MTTGQDVALASAYGDALGAPYEFIPIVLPPQPIELHANAMWERGEWTDDTAMAIPLLEAAARGLDLASDDAQGHAFRHWMEWALVTKDIGNQTARVIGDVRRSVGASDDDAVLADAARTAARRAFETTGSSGNGSLMRTHAVAIALQDRADDEVAAVARAVSALTHPGQDSEESCVIWTVAITAVLRDGRGEGPTLDRGLAQLSAERRAVWTERLQRDAADGLMPWDFANSGYSVDALRAAWSAVGHATSTRACLDLAVRSGDSDTVAAIAGGLAGALWGVADLPTDEVAILHGHPGLDRDGLADLAERARHSTR
ncbi:ADP-ribosylglycohydrolase family protein [Microbacterium dextranolyticum]|uniref:ADP-ribosylglycohydrolase n=1 Tax=Microbacterium dextranolyticum TaxID=36806 RepID=A0A9W6HK80_9MICO|nr:ADP-ribosylglycohydrolase family protein [Microbacterium dextranolyticum]MBM7461792.1 ADP-ribosylglycohydrolase [Microbacterium dextranolyticum]GLJ94033.1 ADP-ribosylglycohydrolase [Microbacterium dextranolyticum]